MTPRDYQWACLVIGVTWAAFTLAAYMWLGG